MSKVDYKVIGPGNYKFEVRIWKENGIWQYSRDNDVDELLDISAEIMENKIDDLHRVEIKTGEKNIDPMFHALKVIDRNGDEMSFEWSDDDKIPKELEEFIEFIG